jgi:hypothetical protein
MEASGVEAGFPLIFLHSITSPSQGFWYTIVLLSSELVGTCCDKLRLRTAKITPINDTEDVVTEDEYSQWLESDELALEDY